MFKDNYYEDLKAPTSLAQDKNGFGLPLPLHFMTTFSPAFTTYELKSGEIDIDGGTRISSM